MKIFLRGLKYLLLLIVLIAALPYITCPIYNRPETSLFEGSSFYNPYSNLDTTKWLKANFHAHTRVWWGLTYGHRSDCGELIKKYNELDYDIIGVSDYQSINPKSSIPVYEHGVGISKNHQLSIGSKNVLYKEYLFYQSFHHKQNIISGLHDGNNIVSVNHPEMRNAYTAEDLKYLRGVDLLEVINHNYNNSQKLWDTALSNGNLMFLISDDDTHDITNPKDFGYAYTMVNSPSSKNEDIINALRKGNAVAVELEPQADMSPQRKLTQSLEIPKLIRCEVQNDSLLIGFDRICDTIKLIGQNGMRLEKMVRSKNVTYKIKPEDTYIRAEVNQSDLSNLILNPVFRYDGGEIHKTGPEINNIYTWLYRGGLILAAIVIIIFSLKRKKR